MKKMYVFLSLSLSLLFLSSYKTVKQRIDKKLLFIVEYTKGSAWDEKKEFPEQKYANHHSTHLQNLRKQSVIQFGARYSDKGIIFIASKNLETAKQIICADSSVITNMFNVTINELSVFYDYKPVK